MAEGASSKLVLADSNEKTRPPFTTYLMTDANAGGHTVAQIEEKRRIRHMKFPPLKGRHDVDSFQTDLQDEGFKKWNDEGDHHATAPYRSYDNIIDPVSGFVSAGGDVDRSTGHRRIRSMVQLNRTPQSAAPCTQNSVRINEPAAPPDLKRDSTYCPGGPTAWNSRKMSDAWIKSQLGGWTSDHDPRKASAEVTKSKSQFEPKPPSAGSKTSRDHLAKKYMYSSSAQRSYEEVPWDTMLPAKSWAPTSTAENKPDMISHRWSNKKYDSAAQEWQSTGRAWDWFQRRRGYYKTQPINFSSSCSRVQQIPNYGGSIGAENLEEIDNTQEPFKPLTAKRVPIPRPSETAHRPNIPGYKGCTLWQGKYAPANAHAVPLPSSQPTTSLIHKPMPLSRESQGNKREAEMSRMITLVPPCNPFNSIEREEVVVS
ncbi:protein SPMIP7-like [Babylonia areolata]|uniref:protein SPMIP7-like n=1 Tax=Babylonia areolata TaxID=304850 RepID=UPI003FD05B7E